MHASARARPRRTPGAPARNEADRGRARGDEIRAFLMDLPNSVSYVILDDREDAATSDEQRARLVRTDASVGLTDADVEKALAVLKLPPPESDDSSSEPETP